MRSCSATSRQAPSAPSRRGGPKALIVPARGLSLLRRGRGVCVPAAARLARADPPRGDVRAEPPRADARPRGAVRRLRSPPRSARCRSTCAIASGCASSAWSASPMRRTPPSTRSRCSCRSCRWRSAVFDILPIAIGPRASGPGGARARRRVERAGHADRGQFRPEPLPHLGGSAPARRAVHAGDPRATQRPAGRAGLRRARRSTG